MSKRRALLVAFSLGVGTSSVLSPFALAQNYCDPTISSCNPQGQGNPYGQNSVSPENQNPYNSQQLPLGDTGSGMPWEGSAPGYGGPGNGYPGGAGSLSMQPVPDYIDNLNGAAGTRQGGQNGQNVYNGINPYASRYAQPPAQPTEFQRFVSASVGRMLPIFGANLFLWSPTTFAPVDQVPVTSNYIVGPGDQLLIRVWGQINFNAEVTVDRSGTVYLPQVGAIHVGGISFSDLHAQLHSNIARIYKTSIYP
jgi:hypothetical protein